MNIKELRNKTIKELNHLLLELRAKLDDLNFKVVQKQLKNVREIRMVKRDIARILMVLKDKSRIDEKQSSDDVKSGSKNNS